MLILSKIVLFLALAAAIVFSLLVLLTGKGDAMSGGGSVRTSYKGKATFDDIMSRAALYLGIGFMALVLVYSVLEKRLQVAGMTPNFSKPAVSAPLDTNKPTTPASNNAPESTNSPAANNAPATTGATNTPAAATNTPATTPSTPPAANNAPAAATNAPASNNAPAK